MNLVQGIESLFRKGLGDTDSTKDFQESHELIYCCGVSKCIYVCVGGGAGIILSGVSLHWGEYAEYYKLTDKNLRKQAQYNECVDSSGVVH